MKTKRKIHDWAIEDLSKKVKENYYVRLTKDFCRINFRLSRDNWNYSTLKSFTLYLEEDGTIWKKDYADYHDYEYHEVTEGNCSFVLALRDIIDSETYLKTYWIKNTDKCKTRLQIKVNKISDIVQKNWIDTKMNCSTRTSINDKWSKEEAYVDLKKRGPKRVSLIADLHYIYGLSYKEIQGITDMHYDSVTKLCRKNKYQCFLKIKTILEKKK